MADFKTTRRDALAAGATIFAAGTTGHANMIDKKDAETWNDQAVSSYQIGDQQGLEGLRRVSGEIPPPASGQVLVGVRAAALNHRDLMIMRGQYGAPKPPSRIPLSDGAGEVVAIGPNVAGVAIGDRVTAPHLVSWLDGDYDPAVFASDVGNTADGWLTEVARLPAAALVKIPDRITYEEAAAWGAAGITAWTVLETLGQIKAGDLVLALGTGGVSILALQLAKMNGASVAITSSSDTKLALARELGADITVNYRTTPEWAQAVLAASGGRGVDIVVETVGLATLPQSLSCCAPNARVGFLGALGGRPDKPTDIGGLLAKNVVLKGITSGSRRMLADLLRACDSNGVKPKIDRVFGFGDAPAAYEYLDQGKHVGKVVINRD